MAASTIPRSYVAGHMVAWYSTNSVSQSGGASYLAIGSTREGWNIRPSFHTQPVHDDAYGEGKADSINQGADMSLDGVLIQAALPQVEAALWNMTGGAGQSNNQVGLKGSDTYGSLVLVPVAGTPAAAKIGAGNAYIFYMAQVINDPSILLSSKLREIPVTFDLLPDPNNTNKFYTVATTPAGCSATQTP